MRRMSEYPLEAGWRLLLEDLGIKPADVLRRAGLPDDLLSRDDVRLETRDYFRFWTAIEAEFDDPAFPLTVGQSIPTEAFQPPVFAALCSPNLAVAFERLSRYKRLVCPMVMSPRRSEDRFTLDMVWSAEPDVPPPALVGLELVFLVQLVRTATRARVEPIEVVSTRELKPAGDYAAYFGVPVTVGGVNRLAFSLEDTDRPFLTSNDSMWRAFEPELRRRLAELDERATTAERVRAALLELLPAGASSMDQVARKLAMSKRTMQRRLQNEETTFQHVLNATREDLARYYLVNTKMSCAEISFLLGFGDPNSFFRAFQDWTGSTPERHRQAGLH